MDHDTRIDLAQRTFPGLRDHAGNFVYGAMRLRISVDYLAFFDRPCLLGCRSRAILSRAPRSGLENNREQLKDNPSLIRCGPDASPLETSAELGSKTDAALQTQFACRRYNYLTWLGKDSRCKRYSHATEGLTKALHVWCWHWLLSGSYGIYKKIDKTPVNQESSGRDKNIELTSTAVPLKEINPEDVSDYAKVNAVAWQNATSILTVFTTYILPMMFALLGTLIGAFRAILNKIADSELSPRDLVRMQIGIPTGLVAGIAMGLFLLVQPPYHCRAPGGYPDN